MGKKSKANRKKAPIATAAVTATAAAAVVATATETKRGEFPKSTFCVKGESFYKKGNHAKAQKIYLQGIEHGCVPCLNEYTTTILLDGATVENRMVSDIFEDNRHLHLALPLSLEGAVRGDPESMSTLFEIYCKVQHEETDICRFGHTTPATPLLMYWNKFSLKNKNWDREERTQQNESNEDLKKELGTQCSVCEKQDSEIVTLMKCDGCKFYYYCSKECQQKMWVEGKHAGVCRHLGLLKKYHKPFAKKIWKDIAVHCIPPQNIPELQELRQQLGLSRPQADYQDLLEARVDSAQFILPRKDGTVQIGSFPRPI